MLKQLLSSYSKRKISHMRVTFSEYVFNQIQKALASKNITMARELFKDYQAITTD